MALILSPTTPSISNLNCTKRERQSPIFYTQLAYDPVIIDSAVLCMVQGGQGSATSSGRARRRRRVSRIWEGKAAAVVKACAHKVAER